MPSGERFGCTEMVQCHKSVIVYCSNRRKTRQNESKTRTLRIILEISESPDSYASNCMALDQRIKRILGCLGAKVPRSIESHFEVIENELIERVAAPSGLSGGELDRILFQNYGDILVRLLCT